MIGQRIHRVASVDSTNALAATIPEHGLIVVADHQTAGRGQYGRIWISEPGESLLMSVVVTPPTELNRPTILTAWAALSVSQAIQEWIGIRPRLKWPNDLLINGRKISGILIEATRRSTVVGIGLNLNQTQERFQSASLHDATSLHMHSSRAFDRDTVLETVRDRLNVIWDTLLSGDTQQLEIEWAERIGLLGWPVRIERSNGTSSTGRLIGISFDGLELVGETGRISVETPESVRGIQGL